MLVFSFDEGSWNEKGLHGRAAGVGSAELRGVGTEVYGWCESTVDHWVPIVSMTLETTFGERTGV